MSDKVEYWDIYDIHKHLTGRRMLRNDWHMADGDYHLSVLGAVCRPDGRYLITRRREDKQWAPGSWEISGGGVMAGETSLEAVRREILEETAIDVRGASGGYAFCYRREDPVDANNYFMDVYRFVLDFDESDVKLQASETDGFMLATSDEIAGLAAQGKFLHYDSIQRIFKQG